MKSFTPFARHHIVSGRTFSRIRDGGLSRPTAVVVGTLLLLGTVAGCSASADSAAPSSADKGVAVGAADQAGGKAAGAVAPEVAGDPQKPTDQQAAAQIEPQQRSLIYTGNISVKVDDVTKAADRAIDLANRMGGAVGADKRQLDADRSEAQLTLRVPSEKFDATLAELAKLGTEQARSVETQDVTEALVDLDSRLATQKASVDRVRALLAKAQTIGEVVSIESELTRREADLDSLEQRRARLSGLVSLSTITVELRGPAAPAPAVTDPDEPGFLAGLKSGWAAFLESIRVVLVIGGWLLPWVIAIGIPLWLFLFFVRRRRTPTPATATAPAATPAATAPVVAGAAE